MELEQAANALARRLLRIRKRSVREASTDERDPLRELEVGLRVGTQLKDQLLKADLCSSCCLVIHMARYFFVSPLSPWPGFRFRRRGRSHVGADGLAGIDFVLELSLGIAAHVSLVAGSWL